MILAWCPLLPQIDSSSDDDRKLSVRDYSCGMSLFLSKYMMLRDATQLLLAIDVVNTYMLGFNLVIAELDGVEFVHEIGIYDSNFSPQYV